MIVKDTLLRNGEKVKEINHEAIGEIIPRHIEIIVGKDTILNIYEPIACHNYNSIEIDNRSINVASIDTILSFYLAFIYNDEYPKELLLLPVVFKFNEYEPTEELFNPVVEPTLLLFND